MQREKGISKQGLGSTKNKTKILRVPRVESDMSEFHDIMDKFTHYPSMQILMTPLLY